MVKKIYYYFSNQLNPYKNIATEYSFFENCPKDALIVYLWKNDNTVVIGKNQNVFAEVDLNALYADNGVVARRLTGGGAVYHDKQNLNFTFIAHDCDYDLNKQFSVITQSLLPFGICAEISGRNDMTVNGKKFSGNAFLHKDGKSMHHGTLLVNTDVQKMQKYLTVSKQKLESKGVKSTASRVINLTTLCDFLTAEKLASQIMETVGKVYDAAVVCTDAKQLLKNCDRWEAKFSDKQWLFNRVVDKNDVFVSHRFDWGCVEVAYSMDCEGTICSVCVFTDSLDTDLAEEAEKQLLGKKIQQLTSQNGFVCDIIDMVKNNR